MSRVPSLLAALGGAALAALTLQEQSTLVPTLVPAALALAGTLVGAVAAWLRRTRLLALGLALATAGVALTGPTLSTPLWGLGTLGLILFVAALTLSLDLPREGGHARLLPVTLLLAVVAAGLGLMLASSTEALAGPSVDARTGVAGYLALVASLTWLIARRAPGGEPS